MKSINSALPEAATRSGSLTCLSPIPVSQWESQGNVWPTVNGWYNMLRPENLRYELIEAGVASCINGRWVIFPDKWQRYCADNHRPPIG